MENSDDYINYESLCKNNQDLTAELKTLKSNPYTYLNVGDYVDARDNFAVWRVGKIINIGKNFFDLAFDGWKQKWNERIFINSNKIAPFRMYTAPYTGAVKQAHRDLALPDLLLMMKQVSYIV